MFLSFLRFYSANASPVRLTEPTEEYILKAKKNEVWRFPLYKSDLEKDCIDNIEVWWYGRAVGSCVDAVPELLTKAGLIDYLPAEKYGKVTITVNDLDNSGFSLLLDNTVVFESSKNSIDELVEEMKSISGVVDAVSDGTDIELTFCKDYCGQAVTVSRSGHFTAIADVEVATSKVQCCCLDRVYAEVKIPCEEGCYQLAIIKEGSTTPISLSSIVVVTENLNDTVLLNFTDEKEVFGQKTAKLNYIIRLSGVFRFLNIYHETTERTLTNGKLQRDNTKIYDVYSFSTRVEHRSFHKMLLMAFSFSKVWVNGIDVFFKEFNQSNAFNDSYSSNFILWHNKPLLDEKECGLSCSENFGSVTTDKTVRIESDTTIKEVKDKAFFEQGEYKLVIPNGELTSIEYEVYRNNILKTSGEILPKKCKRIALNICDCEEYEVRTKRSDC